MRNRDVWTDYKGDFVDWDDFIENEDGDNIEKYIVDDKIYVRITGVYLDIDFMEEEEMEEGEEISEDEYFEDIFQYEISREMLEEDCLEDIVRNLLEEDCGYWCISSYNGEILNPMRLIRDKKIEMLGL